MKLFMAGYRYDADHDGEHVSLWPSYIKRNWFITLQSNRRELREKCSLHCPEVLWDLLFNHIGLPLDTHWQAQEWPVVYLPPGEQFARPGQSPTVYFVKDLATGLVKIGHSKDVEKRLRTIFREGNPYELLGTIDGNHDAYFHSIFDEWRVTGEWFADAPEIRRFIEMYAGLSEKMQESA